MKKKKSNAVIPKDSIHSLIGFILLLTVTTTAGGIFSIKYSDGQVKTAKESFNWPDANGTITESNVKRCWSNENCYEPEIRYSYKVNGKTYSNNTITFDDDFIRINKNWSENFIKDYPVNLPVRVYYNPENPEVSLLEKREIAYTPIWTHVGYFLIITGIIFFVCTSIIFIYHKKFK